MADIQKLHSELSELLNVKAEELRSSLSKELRQKLESTLGHAPGASPTDQLNSAIESLQQFTALLYSDAGQQAGKKLDSAALQILVRATGQWLEILTARKSGGSSDALAAAAAAPAQSAPISQVAAPQPSSNSGRVALDSLPVDEKELHVKAQRFAKLLVDEIRLYNQAKVNEGRQSRSIYKILREDIDKSRETYNRRYANTSVGNAGYFTQEVIRILADNDASLLGSDFPE